MLRCERHASTAGLLGAETAAARVVVQHGLPGPSGKFHR